MDQMCSITDTAHLKFSTFACLGRHAHVENLSYTLPTISGIEPFGMK